jgi:hypothetical protein
MLKDFTGNVWKADAGDKSGMLYLDEAEQTWIYTT